MSEKIDYNKTVFSEDEKIRMRKETDVILHKYPRHIPIVVRTQDNSLKLSKCKYLVGGDLTMGQFMFILRKKLDGKLKASQAIFMFVNNVLPPATKMMSEVYHDNKDPETHLLFIKICKENTFGKKN